MKTTRIATTLMLSLLLIGVSVAEKKTQWSGQVDIAQDEPSSPLAAENVKVVYIKQQPHLQYLVTNVSGDLVQAVAVTMTVYDKQGNLSGGQQWILNPNLLNGEKFSSVLATSLKLKRSSRVVVKFTSAQQGCPNSFCNECTTNAMKACGDRGVSIYSCSTGDTCTCEFTCRESGPRPPIRDKNR